MEKLNLGILIFDDVEVLDFAGPYEVFSRARLVPGPESRRDDESAPFTVFTVAPKREAVRATGGLVVVPDYGFGDAPKIDVLVVPGGWGTRPMLDDTAVLDWIRKVAAGARRTASVCTGALVLAKAGLLRGKRATTHWAALDMLAALDPEVRVERGARWVDDGVVTAAGVAAGIDMALYVVESFCGREVADETAGYIEFPRATTRDE